MRAFSTTSKYAHGLNLPAYDRHSPSPAAPPDSKAKREWEARWNQSFVRTVRCAACPDWSFTGTGDEAQEAFAEHRLERHIA